MNIKTRHLVLSGAGGLVVGMALAASIYAQDRRIETPGITQDFLINEPLAQFPGKRIVVFRGTFEPGASTPLHRHPGTEIMYILDGNGHMEIRGRDSVELTAGKAVLVEPDPGTDSFTHRAINVSETEELNNLVIIVYDEGTRPGLPPIGEGG